MDMPTQTTSTPEEATIPPATPAPGIQQQSSSQPAPMQPVIPEAESHESLIIERFLRNRVEVWRQIARKSHLDRINQQMLVSSTVSLACYGLVMGISHSWMQALSSAVKLPILFLLTLTICLPTLYMFNLLFGGVLSVRQTLALGLSAITVTSALTLAFAPITLFFLITAQGYYFFVLLNVAILTLTGIIGLRFLVDGTRTLNVLSQTEQAAQSLPLPNDQEAATVQRPAATANMTLMYVWLALFAFVGTQLGWTLRPFFGSPIEPFELFRGLEGNFYEAMGDIFIYLLFLR